MRFPILLKWKYLRWVAKRHKIRFNKMMLRGFWIQELTKLPQYRVDELAWFSYSKLRKLYIKEYPKAFLHDPYSDNNDEVSEHRDRQLKKLLNDRD